MSYANPPRSSSSTREHGEHSDPQYRGRGHLAQSSTSSSVAAPEYELSAYPHHTSHGVSLRDQPYLPPTSTMGNQGATHESSPLASNDPLSARETLVGDMGRAQDEFLARDYAMYSTDRSDSRSPNHHAAAHASTSQAQYTKGSTTPIHPGASVTMRAVDSTVSSTQSDRGEGEKADRRYGLPSEKMSGYRSPRNRSQERSAGGPNSGLGNWSGPAGLGASPYGHLGAGNGSNVQSAASSTQNLVYAEGQSELDGGYDTEPRDSGCADSDGWIDHTGDFIKPPSNAFTRTVFAIYDSSFLVRWIIYIIPLLALIWIPGIVGLTVAPNATIWEVPLLWWSAWLSIAWCGWWGAALTARILPHFFRHTVGVIAPEMLHLVTYLKAIKFYVGTALWAMANWVSFLPLIRLHARSSNSDSTLILLTKGLFGIFIVSIILLIEKLLIQIIAHSFHKKSYEDRILEQKFQISALVALYLNTRDLGRSDTLDGGFSGSGRPRNRRQHSDPTLLVKHALRGVKKVAQTATTVIGTVASEIAGEQVLKPTSAQSMVLSSLGSANKSKQLARRIYYSFCPSYRDSLLIEDVSRCFQNREQAERAFSIFDRDGNGDATRDEIEMAVLDIHRERLSLSRSMRDIDSAVGRLDSIVMSLWYVVSILILAGLLNASFNTMIASAGTLVLGLSWLIGTTAQEILASIILLFVKHPYDVGDRVDIDGVPYVVLEMHLLSTVFRNTNGTVTQAPHSLINTKFILNIRRSGAISEPFVWDVAFETPFEKIEQLRARMLAFVEAERRDFLPKVDIMIKDFEEQGKLTLTTDINYRGNWQNGALKAQRRNKFLCAMKMAMAELKIYGPGDNGDPSPPPPDPTKIIMVPFVDPGHEEHVEATTVGQEDTAKTSATNLASKANNVAMELTNRRGIVDDEGDDYDTRDRDGVRNELRK
ncbi:BZ3500_MvSof-1268-A1-R1_Chr11-2g03397 [Microbotryum saponariae]|uniref:Mechanosensitive ion channel protein n=1 Tax=Microbotryum saponariae TaxID=289078 RepID=A0A2X0KNC0_9BASI|nr:BZ3500_MvSof-1268-A1-R1_Chr11-2g03397 [Microbotryum saponariae]SDA03287.1 BZ3501_MvSof-1269-A2-R1_Chr11g02968 [Microbotryum saponariae]